MVAAMRDGDIMQLKYFSFICTSYQRLEEKKHGERRGGIGGAKKKALRFHASGKSGAAKTDIIRRDGINLREKWRAWASLQYNRLYKCAEEMHL